MQNKFILTTIFSLFIFVFGASGQKLVNSPYSRFNIGALEPAASFKSLGMGGIGTALRDNSSTFFANPASYSSLDTNSFVFDFGFDYSMNYVSNGGPSYFSDDVNFDHLIMSFPLKKGWGVAVGVVPVSNGYYKLFETVLVNDPEYDPLTGAYTSFHAGEGGYNNFFAGTGLKITKNISLGVNMNVLFGQTKRVYQVDFSDILNSFNNNTTETMQLGGINFDYGVQYARSLKKNSFINAGVSFTSSKNYNSTYDRYSYRYTVFNNTDTINYISDDSTKAFFPGTLRIGIAFGKKDKFTAGFDFITTKWSDAKFPGLNGYAGDTRSFRLGAEFIPEKYSNYSFLKRVEYRIGGHIGDNYLIAGGEQVKEYGASFGVGIPMSRSLSEKRSLSRTNVFFDYTRKYGSPSGTLHNENFFTMGISLNIYDFWFVKRKYD